MGSASNSNSIGSMPQRVVAGMPEAVKAKFIAPQDPRNRPRGSKPVAYLDAGNLAPRPQGTQFLGS